MCSARERAKSLRNNWLSSPRVIRPSLPCRKAPTLNRSGDARRTTSTTTQVPQPLVSNIHEADLATGFGTVELPYALERKYPKANRE